MDETQVDTGTKRPDYVEHLGIKISVPEDMVSDTVFKFMKEGRYESREGKVVNQIIEEGERILELGGGLGFISTIAALNKKTSAILTFEANPGLSDVISSTHKLNNVSNVEVRTGVLVKEAREESVPFYIRKDFWGSSLAAREGDTKSKKVLVPVYELSWVLGEFKLTMIVCDIEGGEVDLFDGRRLFNVNKVLIEIHEQSTGPRGVQSVFRAFTQAGFYYDQNYSSGSVILFRRLIEDPIV